MKMNNNNNNIFNKSAINWLIPIYLTPTRNPYK